MSNILLVEPSFPFPSKSKHGANEIHKNFVPIGLLKLGAFYKFEGEKVKLIRGQKSFKELKFKPNKILITSLFTYWSEIFWQTVDYYRKLFPKAIIQVGGIYVTLHCETPDFLRLATKYKVKISKGLDSSAEKFLPDYSLLSGKCDYHVTHGMRGCIRRCKFCGTWRLEPIMTFKTAKDLVGELKMVGKNKVIFYDNNFLANPNIEEILKELSNLRINGKPVIFESQSGFDGRLLEKNSKLAKLIKKARFQNIRIAWDNGVEDQKSIKNQIDILKKAGFVKKDISIFMIYNFINSLENMIIKQKLCLKWGTQISDCRYRPLASTFDNYKPSAWKKGQTEKDYYIHKEGGWTDGKIRLFRNLIRTHNITIRYAKDKNKNFDKLFKIYWKINDPKKYLEFMKTMIGYDKKMEKWSSIHNTYKFFGLGRPPKMEVIEKDETLMLQIKLMNKFKNIYKKRNNNSKLLDYTYQLITGVIKENEKENGKLKENYIFDFIENKMIAYSKLSSDSFDNKKVNNF